MKYEQGMLPLMIDTPVYRHWYYSTETMGRHTKPRMVAAKGHRIITSVRWRRDDYRKTVNKLKI